MTNNKLKIKRAMCKAREDIIKRYKGEYRKRYYHYLEMEGYKQRGGRWMRRGKTNQIMIREYLMKNKTSNVQDILNYLKSKGRIITKNTLRTYYLPKVKK